MAAAETVNTIPWWKEPTKDQWYAYFAAWGGWTLDAFDFTAFLLIIAPIAKEFGVPVPAVAAVLTITLWMRLIGATASGWLADRIGRKTPLMISIAWYSVCNFMAGLAPSFFLLFLFRALLGICMGAVMQGSWGIGFLLSSAIYGLFYSYIGWRGLLMIGIAPALLIIYIRLFVKEPEIWVENQRQQKAQNREVRAPLFSIFKPEMLGNTLTTCLMMASAFVIYYANYALFATHLQLDLHLSPALVALPIALANTCFFLSSLFWGWLGERIGRRWAIIIPAAFGVPTAFLYLTTQDYTLIVIGFALQGMFACGGMHVQYPAYLSERFPTEVRATAGAFCFHQGAIWGGLISPLLIMYATAYHITLSGPILVTTVVGLAIFLVAVLLSPETKGKVLVAELTVA